MTDKSSPGAMVAEAYIEALKTHGIQYVFANAGTDFAPLIEGLVASAENGRAIPEFPYAHTAAENVAMGMAYGYYKLTGQMTGVMVHVTVGTANALCGVMNASRDNVPVLLAAGRTPITETGELGSRNGHIHWGQESFDQGGMVREYVKWDYELRSGQPVEKIVRRAVSIAMADPKGPVYLTLPREVLAEKVRGEGEEKYSHINLVDAEPSLNAIEKAADYIAMAENVLIVAGNLGPSIEEFEALDSLAMEHAIAVAQTHAATLPSAHPMNFASVSKALLEWADTIVVLSSPVPWIPSNASPLRGTKLIHVATDPSYQRYPYRGYDMSLAIAGKPATALRMLNQALKSKLANKAAIVDARRRRIAGMQEKASSERARRLSEVRSSHPIHPVWISHCLNEVKSEDAVIVSELGAPFPHLKFTKPGSYLGASGAGGLGKALGEALGAKLATPDRQVIASVGDGSYMFGIPSAAHFVGRAHNLPTLTVVSNNSQWLAVRMSTKSIFPEGRAARANAMPLTDLAPSPDFEKIVEASGGVGERVEDPEQLLPALERGAIQVEQGVSAVLNVITSADRS